MVFGRDVYCLCKGTLNSQTLIKGEWHTLPYLKKKIGSKFANFCQKSSVLNNQSCHLSSLLIGWLIMSTSILMIKIAQLPFIPGSHVLESRSPLHTIVTMYMAAMQWWSTAMKTLTWILGHPLAEIRGNLPEGVAKIRVAKFLKFHVTLRCSEMFFFYSNQFK